MATESKKTSGGRRGLRILVWVLGVFVVLLVVVYFVATSSWFLKSVILPRVSESVGADVTVRDASISPFSQVVLHDLKVQTKGEEPLLTVREVRARYSLTKMMGGNMLIHEVIVVSPVISLVEKPDGSNNLDPVMKKMEEEAAPDEESTEPVQLDLRKLTVSDGTIRQITHYDGGKRDLTEISKLTVTLENIRNGQTGKLSVGGDVAAEQNPPSPGTNGTLAGTLNGTFNLGLSADLLPSLIQGNARFTATRAAGGMAMMGGFATELDVDITPTEIRQVLLRLAKGPANLAQLRAQGPFKMETTEGQISITLEGVDRQLLNIAGADNGLDFGSTKISSTNLVSLTKQGEQIALQGQFGASQFQVIRTNEATPPLNFRADYSINVDQPKSQALIQVFNLVGIQNNQTILRGELSNPMTISWADTTNGVGTSDLTLTVTNLDLANWKAFLGTVAPAGMANARMQLRSEQGGAILNFNLDSRLENLTLVAGTNQVTQAGVFLKAQGKGEEFARFTIPQYSLEVTHRGQAAAQVNGGGVYDNDKQTADFQLTGSASLPRLMQVVPQPDAAFSAGDLRMRMRLTQTQDVQTVIGALSLTNLTGAFGANVFQAYNVNSDVDVLMKGDRVDIRKATGSVSQAQNAGGTFQLSGNYNISNETGRITAKLDNFNQHALTPFVQSSLGEKQLKSIYVGGNLTAEMPAASNALVKADLLVTNLVVQDPKLKTPATPLQVGLNLDASMRGEVAEIRDSRLQLTPTGRGSNLVQFVAKIDMTKTNAMQGSMRLTADSMDLTKYYDIFETTSAAEEAEASTTSTEGEPEPIDVPLTNFVAEATINRLYLRELEITNMRATVRIDGPRIVVKPFQMSMNGSPMEASADVNVGVRGFQYQTAFSAKNVPFAPLVNTFSPENKGKMAGTLTAVGNVKGAGTTGASLQKNLVGDFDIATTNLNLQISNVESPLLKSVVNVIVILPELRKNPNAALGSLVGSVLGGGSRSTTPGWLDELTASPIDIIEARGRAAAGTAELQKAFVQSRAFQVETRGTVGLASELTNSTLSFPLTVSLRRPLAEKINFVPAGTPTNLTYVKLPDYVTIKGTMGEPKTEINKMALLGTALEQLGGNIPGVDQKTGNLIQGLGGILTGRQPQTPGAQSVTNQPGVTAPRTNAVTPQPQNQSPLGGLLNQLMRPAPATNTPATSPGTNAPAATNQAPVGNLLNQLLGPGRK